MTKVIRESKNGTKYVYESKSYWDKEKKAPRTKQTYVGKLDPITGELIPKRIEAIEASPITQPKIKTIGATMLFEKVSEETKLTRVLKQIFPEQGEELLSLAYYISHSNRALCHCETWARDHRIPSDKSLTSKNISRILSEISPDKINAFLALWAKQFSDKEVLYYDITSISSYAKSMNFVRYGYNRDGESLPQINLAMLYARDSQLPVYYRRVPGNITDVTTLQKTMQLLDFSGKQRQSFVMDMSFYSQANLSALYAKKYYFTMGVPINRKWITAAIDENYESLEDIENRYKQGKSILYVKTSLKKHDGHRCYVHMYYNPSKKSFSNEDFVEDLVYYKEQLEQHGLEWIGRKEHYEQFLNIQETPKRGLRISYNNESIRSHKARYEGIFVLVSNHQKDAIKALEDYRRKDMIEKGFDDIKNAEDGRRLRVHSDRSVESRLFLNFLALIIRSAIANKIRGNKKLEAIGVARLLQEMNTLREVTEEHRYRSVITEPTKIQKLVIDAFELEISKT